MSDHTEAPSGDPLRMRRSPSQKRSRERVDVILSRATELIADQGSDAMRMSELAERAGISIGSLYQYFPDKRAVVGTLAERYNAASRACIEKGLAKVERLEDLETAFADLIDIYYALFLAEPVIRDVWSATQADAVLRQKELEESRLNGALLASTLAKLRPDADGASLQASALLVMHLGEATMRLAVSVHRSEGDALVESYKRLAIRELTGR